MPKAFNLFTDTIQKIDLEKIATQDNEVNQKYLDEILMRMKNINDEFAETTSEKLIDKAVNIFSMLMTRSTSSATDCTKSDPNHYPCRNIFFGQVLKFFLTIGTEDETIAALKESDFIVELFVNFELSKSNIYVDFFEIILDSLSTEKVLGMSTKKGTQIPIVAIGLKKVMMIETILKHCDKANIDINKFRFLGGRTLLSSACFNPGGTIPSVIKMLLKSGADPRLLTINASSQQQPECSAFEHIAQVNDLELFAYLINHSFQKYGKVEFHSNDTTAQMLFKRLAEYQSNFDRYSNTTPSSTLSEISEPLQFLNDRISDREVGINFGLTDVVRQCSNVVQQKSNLYG